MTSKFTLRSLLLLICFGLPCVLAATAKENTPMDAFIMRVKETNKFVTVSNIWQPDNNLDKTAMLKYVAKAQPLTIDYGFLSSFVNQKTMAISLVVPNADGGTYTIDLARYDFFTNDFEVHEMGAGNTDKLFGYTPGVYYRGVVSGIPGSVAAFSFFNNEVYGIFSIPGEGNYNVVPNTMEGKDYDYNQHYVLFNDQDLKVMDHAPGCGTDRLPEYDPEAGAKTTTTPGNNVYNNCTEVRCFETADYTMYVKKGSSTTNSTNYLTSLFNNKSTLYRNEGIIIVLKYIQINTAPDAYQSISTANSGLFLEKFGQVTQNTLHGCDIATLFSTMHNGTMGGVAWLKAMCTSYNSSNFFGPYAFCNITNSSTLSATPFPTYSWDVEVSTHEMGHNLGSPHTHRCCWNPPGTGTTAIDGCYTIEGTCPDPGNPTSAVGGTIMSYCHLTSSGTHFTNGFGQQPGDTIRRYIKNKFSTTCGEHYKPNIALSRSKKIMLANRECTDLASGVSTTYYWNDNYTASQADDTLVLMIIKNGNTIGNMNESAFSVSTGTNTGYGSNRGDTILFPAGTAGVSAKNYAMNRYWKVATTSTPTSNVEVIFPFTSTDTSDVNGSIPGATAPLSNYRMYKVKTPTDPNPAANFTGAIASSFNVYTYGTTASTTNWSLTTSGTTQLAHMLMTNLAGGGTGFYGYAGTAVDDENILNSSIYVYPNPANDQVSIEANGVDVTGIQITDIQGRTMKTISNNDNKSLISIQLTDLSAGLYFVQVHTLSGSLTRKVVVIK